MGNSAPHAGTGSVGPIRCRSTAPPHFPPYGGGTPSAPPRRGRAAEPARYNGHALRTAGHGGHGATMAKLQVPTSRTAAVSRREALIIAVGAAGATLVTRAATA